MKKIMTLLLMVMMAVGTCWMVSSCDKDDEDTQTKELLFVDHLSGRWVCQESWCDLVFEYKPSGGYAESKYFGIHGNVRIAVFSTSETTGSIMLNHSLNLAAILKDHNTMVCDIFDGESKWEDIVFTRDTGWRPDALF